MTYRHSVITAAALALSATAVVAQNPQPEPRQEQQQDAPPQQVAFAQRRLSLMLRGITLTPEQQARVDSVASRYNSRLPTMPVDSVEANQRDSARAALEQFDREIRVTLTAEQQRTWDRNLENSRVNTDVARRPRPGEIRPERQNQPEQQP